MSITILSISNMKLWMWGKNKGIPSTYHPHKEFARRGHNVHFVCPWKIGEEKEENKEGINIHRHDFPFNFRTNVYIQTNTFWRRVKGSFASNINSLLYQVFGFWFGLKVGKKIKPDIVYAHTPGSVFPAFLVSRLLGAHLVIRIYGVWQLYWRWNDIWYRIRRFNSYLAFKVPADYFIITKDGSNGHLLARKFGVPDDKIKNWRNGIDEEIYEPILNARENICKTYDISIDSKIILSTCRLVSVYGVDVLMQVLKGVFKKEEDAVCIFAGDGPDRSAMEQYARKNSFENRIYFAGIVERQTIKKLLYASDIVVYLPRYHNCTNTMWEAMASGRCIVTTETESIKEVLTSGEDVLFVSAADTETAAEKVIALLDDEHMRDKLGRAARKRAREVLESWRDRAAKEAELFEELICKKEKRNC